MSSLIAAYTCGARRWTALEIEALWMMRAPTGTIAVLTAFAVDHALGEPPVRWHPVVWMGRALSATGAPWPRASPSRAFMYGMIAWCAGAFMVMVLAAGLFQAILLVPDREQSLWPRLLHGVLLGLCLKPLLAWRMLDAEVAAVEQALADGLEAGRGALSRLVSRDTAALCATEVRESALESLAENLNDSLVAPLFWFLLGGLPGAALYRFANTADAMWGYRGRWEWAGKWAARADDALSYIPARVTAALLALAAPHGLKGLRCEAQRTPSPNGGWPMAMMALALDVRLSKPGQYVLHAAGQAAAQRHLVRGLRLAERAAWAAVAAACLMLLVVRL
jgi:adenosylcobinamide-phosphate synthase